MPGATGSRLKALLVILTFLSVQIASGFQRISVILSLKEALCSRTSNHRDSLYCRSPESSDNISPVVITSERIRYSQTLAKVASVLLTPFVATVGLKFVSPARAQVVENLVIPLSTYDGVYCMNYTVNGNQYRGIVDTGSPFQIGRASCRERVLWYV